MKYLKIILSAVSLLAVVACFSGVKEAAFAPAVQFTPAVLSALKPESAADFIPLAVILVLTVLFGRIYCEAICPLGIVQSLASRIFHPKSAVRRVCTRLPQRPVQIVLRFVVLGVFLALFAVGAGAWAGFLDPYSLFGKAFSLAMPFALAGFGVVVLAMFGKGRFWCNYICPVGTVFHFLSRFSIVRNKVGPGCGNCRACFARESCSAAAGDGVTRRDTIKGVAAAAVVEKTTDGGFAPVSLPGKPSRPASVLPPGAVSRDDFALKCTGCQLCVVNCPEHIISPSMSLGSFGQVELDFRRGYCRLGCNTCGTVCPSGAITEVRKELRAHLHMGHAIWKKDRCVRTVNGDKCTACLRNCPVQAIHLVGDFPVIDKHACIGCGACEHVCPARPLPAVFVKGFDVQRRVTPIGEEDLIAEMHKLVKEGRSIVVARDGIITAQADGDGIKPAMEMLETLRLGRSIVFDRIVGRAAAAIFIKGGARKVCALVMSAPAAELLKAHGVGVYAVETVEKIVNRRKTGMCPMDTAVAGIDDIDEMISVLNRQTTK